METAVAKRPCPGAIPDRSIAFVAVVLGMAVFLAAGCGSGPASQGPSPTATVAVVPPSVDLEAIRDAIFARYQDDLFGVGIGAGYVDVRLAATATTQAAEILATYGSIVRVSVGFFPYPAPASAPGNGCGDAFGGWPAVDPGPWRATIQLPAGSLTHARAFAAKVRLTNTGHGALALSSGSPLLVYLFQPGATAPVGASPGAVGGVGISRTIDGGASIDIDASGGTASCDLRLGYELPDGSYIAKAAVELDQANGPGFFWSEPLPIELESTAATPSPAPSSWSPVDVALASFAALNDDNMARAASFWVPEKRADRLRSDAPPRGVFGNVQCRPGQRYDGQVGDTATDAGVSCQFDIRDDWGGFSAGHWEWGVFLRRQGTGPWLIYDWGQG